MLIHLCTGQKAGVGEHQPWQVQRTSWEHLRWEGGNGATPQSEAEKLYSFLCCAEMEVGAELGRDVVMVLGSAKWMPLSP